MTQISELILFYDNNAQTANGNASGGNASGVNALGGNGSGKPVVLRWQNGEGAYFGIIDREGNLGLSSDQPISEPCVAVMNSPSHSSGLYIDMVETVVEPDLNVVKLSRTFHNKTCYITGHNDSTVDGRVSITKYGKRELDNIYCTLTSITLIATDFLEWHPSHWRQTFSKESCPYLEVVPEVQNTVLLFGQFRD